MKYFFYLCTLLLLVGCSENFIGEEPNTNIKKSYYAVIDNEMTRTYLDGDIKIHWTAKDCIALFDKNTSIRKCQFAGETGALEGIFNELSIDDSYNVVVPYTYAISPYFSGDYLDEYGEPSFRLFEMPQMEQTYVENSFGLGANSMVAISDNDRLLFKNVGSYLRVRLYGEDVAVSSVSITAKGNAAIFGSAKVTPSLNGEMTFEAVDERYQTISLNCISPITIGTDVNNATDFWLVLPPITFANGFSVKVQNSQGAFQTYDIEGPFTFARNTYYNMLREVTIGSDVPSLRGDVYYGSPSIGEGLDWDEGGETETLAWIERLPTIINSLVDSNPIVKNDDKIANPGKLVKLTDVVSATGTYNFYNANNTNIDWGQPVLIYPKTFGEMKKITDSMSSPMSINSSDAKGFYKSEIMLDDIAYLVYIQKTPNSTSTEVEPLPYNFY